MRKWTAAALAALLSFASASRSGAQGRDTDEPPASENWDSTTVEATSILGEFLYQNNEQKAAKEMFSDSLGTSTKIHSPQGRIIAMDLFRSAQIEIKEGDVAKARYHLEILCSRYADTTWAAKGEVLLRNLPKPIQIKDEDEPLAAAPDPMQPELVLRRLQSALREDKVDEAVEASRTFLTRFSAHALAPEVKVTQAAMLLRAGDSTQAAAVLEKVLQGSIEPALSSKARYLLGMAYLIQGDREGVARVISAEGAKGDRWASMALVWRGLAAEQSGKWTGGESLLKRSLESRYNSPAKAYALAGLAAGASHRQKRESSAAMLAASREARHHGLNSLGEYAQLMLGHMLAGQRRFAEAAKAYEDFEAAFPGSADGPEAGYQGAMAWKKAGQNQKAADAFARLAKRYPDSGKAQDAYLQMGQIYADQGAVNKAIGAYKQMAAQGGSDKDAMLLIAKVHYNRKEYAQAIPIYEQFLQDSPNDPRANEIQDLLLSSYWLGKRDDPGLAHAVEAYPNHPLVVHIRWALGAKAYKAKDYARAEAHFRSLVADFPKSTYVPGSLYYEAECLAQRQDYAGAAEAYRRLAAYPKSPYAHEASFRLGLALMQSGDFDGAAEAYRRYKPGPKDPLAADALFNRALALDKGGRKTEAIAAYQNFLVKNPKYPRASWIWLQIATAKQADGDYATAAQAYSRISGTDRLQALYNRGWCLEKLRQRAQALKVYEQLRAARPPSDSYRLKGVLRLALLYELSSDRRAKGLYQEVLALSGDSSLTNVARKRLGLTPEPNTASVVAPQPEREDLAPPQASRPAAARDRSVDNVSYAPPRRGQDNEEAPIYEPRRQTRSREAAGDDQAPAGRRAAAPMREKPRSQPDEAVTFLH